MSSSSKRLEQLEHQLDAALEAHEQNPDPLCGLIEIPPQDNGKRSAPLKEAFERYQDRGGGTAAMGD